MFFFNPPTTAVDNLCFILFERERMGWGGREGNSAKFWEAEGGETCKTRLRKKRGGALRARYRTALPPRRTASKTLPKKFIPLTLLLLGTPRESRSDARPRSRAGGRSPQRRKQPRASRSPQPKAFPTRNNFAYPEAWLLSLSPNIRTLLPVLPPPPQVSQTTCPPTKSVSNPKRVCQPGSFAPPPTT